MLTETADISLSQGLAGQDAHIDTLLRLWTELQASSADAAQDPMSSNLFAFADSAVFLAVIIAKENPRAKNGAPESFALGAPAAAARLPQCRSSADDTPPGQSSGTSAAAHAAADTPDTQMAAHERDVPDERNLWPNYDPVRRTTQPDTQIAEHDLEPPYDADVPDELNLWPNYDGVRRTNQPVGLVYLTSPPHVSTAPAGDLNIGVVLDPAFRGRGYARQALELVLAWVFDEVKFHRVQAAVLDAPEKLRALTLFTQMGFGHEGTRRRAVFSPVENTWKDATYLAMLDTEWLMRAYFAPAPKSLWDEMFLRHHREREDLLRWDARLLQRTASMETLRHADTALTPDSEPSRSRERTSWDSKRGLEADAPSDAEGAPDGGKPRPRPLFDLKRGLELIPSDVGAAPSDSEGASDKGKDHDDAAASPPPSSESSYASASEDSDFDLPLQIRRTSVAGDVASGRRVPADPFADPARDARSSSPESTIGSVDSRWDMFETSSADGSSNFDSLRGSDVE